MAERIARLFTESGPSPVPRRGDQGPAGRRPHRAAAGPVGGDTEFEHKIRGGGRAHLRYQHNVENTWRRNAADVVAIGVDDVADPR